MKADRLDIAAVSHGSWSPASRQNMLESDTFDLWVWNTLRRTTLRLGTTSLTPGVGRRTS
jgi:hypothetical protein